MMMMVMTMMVMVMMTAIPAADWEAARVSSSLYSKFSADDQNNFNLWSIQSKGLSFDQCEWKIYLFINMIKVTLVLCSILLAELSSDQYDRFHISTLLPGRVTTPLLPVNCELLLLIMITIRWFSCWIGIYCSVVADGSIVLSCLININSLTTTLW